MEYVLAPVLEYVLSKSDLFSFFFLVFFLSFFGFSECFLFDQGVRRCEVSFGGERLVRRKAWEIMAAALTLSNEGGLTMEK